MRLTALAEPAVNSDEMSRGIAPARPHKRIPFEGR
jgi:hypothetical protein